MSRKAIPADLRRLVAERAGGSCEYCLVHENDSFFGFEVDHIISTKHGGATEVSNLAFSCLPCNRSKGSDLGSLAPETRELTRFFDPRRDRWDEHFALADDGATVEPRTPVGAVTITILGLNTTERVLERQALRAIGRYPSPTLRVQ